MDEKRLEGRLALLKTVLLFFKEKELTRKEEELLQ